MPGAESVGLRVLHVVPSLDVSGGGPARSVIRLAAAQLDLGISVCVVSGGAEGARQMAARAAPGVEIRGAGHLPLPFELPSARLHGVLGEEIGRANIAHLHSLWNGTVTAASRAARRVGVPYVISPRGMLDPMAIRRRRGLKTLYRALVDRSTAEGAAGWHFLTPEERNSAVWPPAADQRVAVAPNGVDVDVVQRAAGSFSPDLFADGGPNLLYLGRLHATKGLGLQIDALAVLKAQGIDARLYLVGPDDGEAAGLKRHARASGVDDRVYISAPVYSDQRFALLKSADCVLLSSHFEGNSVTAMETMAVGGVLVATRTTNLDEAAHRDAAIVVERDAVALADAIARVLQHSQLARSLRQHAVDYARAELESTVIARRMLSFYDEVLAITFAREHAHG